MWQAISNLIRLVPALVRELPEQVRTPAAAAWCMGGLIVVIVVLLVAVVLALPEGLWAKDWLIVALVSVALALLLMLAICALFIVAGVVERFFGRR